MNTPMFGREHDLEDYAAKKTIAARLRTGCTAFATGREKATRRTFRQQVPVRQEIGTMLI